MNKHNSKFQQRPGAQYIFGGTIYDGKLFNYLIVTSLALACSYGNSNFCFLLAWYRCVATKARSI